MLLNSIVIRNLREAAEAVGVRPAELARPFEREFPGLLNESSRVEWRTFTEILEHLSCLLGRDPDRLREVGRRMSHVPSYALVGRVVQSVVSVPMLYRATDRWLTSANFPVLRVFLRFPTSERMQMHLQIREPYAPSEPFFHVSAGAIETLPELLELPSAVILESLVRPRTADFDVRLPRMPAARRLWGATRTVFGFRAARAALEEQRRELSLNVAELERARDELRSVLDRLPNLVLVHVRGTILWANRPLLAALGYEEVADVVGASVLDIVAPQSRDEVRERLPRPVDDAPAGVPSPRLRAVVLTSRAGEKVVVEVAPAQTVVFEGTPARLVVGRDVTDRVMMERRLLVADRMAAVGLLAAGVAHEVNNPLAYILNNIEIAQKAISGIGSPADVARQSLSIALEGVDRIRTVVRDLLMLARGDDRIEGLVDVRAVAESTIALARPEIERRTQLVVDASAAPLVHGTEARVARILLNLINNALEAMRGLPRDRCKLVVRIGSASDGRLLLEVSDSGRGIDPNDLPRLFEPFFTTKAAGEGTGLGLPIVQRLVMELGGEIAVTSRLGHGASFRVLLPSAATRAGAAAAGSRTD